MSAPLAERLAALAASWRETAAIARRYAANHPDEAREAHTKAHMFEGLAKELEAELRAEDK